MKKPETRAKLTEVAHPQRSRPGSSVVERGPEKAGVGGSIPSLATIFSITYNPSRPEICSDLFQFQIQACRNLSHHGWNGSGPAQFRNRRGSASLRGES
jgi:hypothetical protein